MRGSLAILHLPLISFILIISINTTVWAWISPYVDSSGGTRYAAIRRHAPRDAKPASRLAASAESNDAAAKLKEQAETLRKEIEAFEQGKQNAERDERRKAEQVRAEQTALRDRYSAIVPILKPDGTVLLENCEFPPRYKDGSSYITICEASLPLGILLGEAEGDLTGMTVVDEVAVGSNGEQGGLLEGDIVRAFTACKMGMDMPTWQVIAGGIGVPKTRRFMYSVDRRPFEEVMDAVASNRMDPEQRPVFIVVERRE